MGFYSTSTFPKNGEAHDERFPRFHLNVRMMK